LRACGISNSIALKAFYLECYSRGIRESGFRNWLSKSAAALTLFLILPDIIPVQPIHRHGMSLGRRLALSVLAIASLVLALSYSSLHAIRIWTSCSMPQPMSP
jgi:hypothetical protein